MNGKTNIFCVLPLLHLYKIVSPVPATMTTNTTSVLLIIKLTRCMRKLWHCSINSDTSQSDSERDWNIKAFPAKTFQQQQNCYVSNEWVCTHSNSIQMEKVELQNLSIYQLLIYCEYAWTVCEYALRSSFSWLPHLWSSSFFIFIWINIFM